MSNTESCTSKSIFRCMGKGTVEKNTLRKKKHLVWTGLWLNESLFFFIVYMRLETRYLWFLEVAKQWTIRLKERLWRERIKIDNAERSVNATWIKSTDESGQEREADKKKKPVLTG